MAFPKRSVVRVAPFTVPLFPFPLASFALPQKGQEPTSPLVSVPFSVGQAEEVTLLDAVRVAEPLVQIAVSLTVMVGSITSMVCELLQLCPLAVTVQVYVVVEVDETVILGVVAPPGDQL